jgi:hypothetical protein
MHILSPNKRKKFKQMLSDRKLMAMGHERSADGGIHATRDYNNVINVLQNTKKLRRAIQNKRCGMMTSGVVLIHDNARPHTAARTRPLLKRLNWGLFDHLYYSLDMASRDYHQFTRTYLKN